MKKLYIIFTFIIVTISVSAQDIIIKNLDNEILNGETIQVYADINEPYNSGNLYLLIQNQASNSLDLKVKKEYIDIVEGTTNDFCWSGTCLPPFTMETGALSLPAGETYDGFSVHYHCQGHQGNSTIKYTVFEEDGPEAFFTVQFSTDLTGLSSLFIDDLHIFPNPAKNNFSIEVSNSISKIEIFNVLGEMIYQNNTGNEKTNIDCSIWNNGVYFVRTFDGDNLVQTQKLIVSQ
jgi:hypothetical protein